ncbi:hypothetical protein HRM2_12550 [Desulforapulum autotrophicum HRM2]|uniref:Uncharacterized protein n=1 Tax=Desulforapulum autotrophicum (strain ATCC 43914 / DSM 3382 / VKM B-1955 / HRM2) TaxID=177437 RepID=C0QM61_DESAH|nr:hypothetical protein [Desulforapulum autotrophicum]ACN14367.1 hypothetical protein HRM2_12550 [Desulforapulum autotrophicum HRM2]
MVIKIVVDARKDRFDAGSAWEMIQHSPAIVTAKGKKVQVWNPALDDREKILKQVMGPSGNLRAPAFQTKDCFVIGFNADYYDSWK